MDKIEARDVYYVSKILIWEWNGKGNKEERGKKTRHWEVKLWGIGGSRPEAWGQNYPRGSAT